jgi:hypothetical protein
MISGRTMMRKPRQALLQALLLTATLPLHAATVEQAAARQPAAASGTVDAAADVDWVLAAIARPAPARTPFVELRGSALLKAPLRIVGEYRREAGRREAGRREVGQREADDTLVRQVTSPYAETTTISDGTVRIEREGRATRSFPMSRAPELAALQASFGALLAGDRERLERHYRVEVDGRRDAWRLRLTPREGAVAQRIARVTLFGRGAELRCIESSIADKSPAGGSVQRSLLAGAAAEAGGIDDADALRALCRGGHVDRVDQANEDDA